MFSLQRHRQPNQHRVSKYSDSTLPRVHKTPTHLCWRELNKKNVFKNRVCMFDILFHSQPPSISKETEYESKI